MKKIVPLVVLLLFLAAPAAPPAGAAPEAPPFKIGLAKVDLTPDPTKSPITLNGYGARMHHPATGVLDPIYARAMVIEDPAGRLVALVSLDLCFVNEEVFDTVVERLRGLGVTEHNLLLAGTHTHDAPSAYDRRWIATAIMGAYDPQIFAQVVDGTVRAVEQAFAARREAVLRYDVSELPGMNRSRRDPAFDVGVGGFDPTSAIKPNPEKYPTDRRLTILRADDPQGNTFGVFVRFSAHPTILSPENMKISADWPGVMTARLEAKLGAGAVAMFVNGAEGDAAPLPDWSNPEQEIRDMKDYGDKMAAAVEARLPAAQPMTARFVAGHTTRRALGKVTPRPFGGMPMNPGFARVLYLRPDQPFQALRIGPLMLLAVPGEPTTATGQELEALCGGDVQCLTVGPANGYQGYFVTPAEYDEGGYQADSCFYGKNAVAKIREAMKQSVRIVSVRP